MGICLYQAKDQSRGDDFVKRSPDAILYHQIGWREVVERSFGHRGYYWFAEDSAKSIKGVFLVIHLKNFFFGSFMVSLPYCNYGGICAVDDVVRFDLLDAAVEGVKRAGAAHVECRQQTQIRVDLPVKTAKVPMQLGLPSSANVLFQSFDAKLRSQIRKPIKEGVEARVNGIKGLESFYDVFSRQNMQCGNACVLKCIFNKYPNCFSGTCPMNRSASYNCEVYVLFVSRYAGKVKDKWRCLSSLYSVRSIL